MSQSAEPMAYQIAQARGAAQGLVALFNMADEQAWASLGRPSARSIAQLGGLILGKLDLGLQDLGYNTDDEPATPPG